MRFLLVALSKRLLASLVLALLFCLILFPKSSSAQFGGNLGAVSGTILWGSEAINARMVFTGNATGFTLGIHPSASPTFDTGFNLPADTYTVKIYLTQNSGTQDIGLIDTEQVVVTNGQTTNFNFDASTVTGLVKGSLTVNGQPTGGNLQFCSPVVTDPCPSPISSGKGPLFSFGTDFSVALPPGDYRAHVTTTSGIDAGIVPITVTAGQIIDGPSMNYALNLGEVSGSVLWGTRIISARILFTGNTNGLSFRGNPDQSSVSPTFDTGFNLPADAYTAKIFLRQNSNTQDIAQIATSQVTVVSGQTTNFNFDASTASGLVVGDLKINGQPTGGNLQFCSPVVTDPCVMVGSSRYGPIFSFDPSGFTVALPSGSYRAHVTTTYGVDMGILPITIINGQLLNLAYSDVTPTPTSIPTPTNTPTPTPSITPTPTPIPTYSLSGVVYNDTNQNGVQDTGETGYAGATVILDENQAVVTDSNGNYTFQNLTPGTYQEALALPTGYEATTTNPVSVALSTDTTQNFGIAAIPTPTPTNTPTPTPTVTPTPALVLGINTGGDTQGSFVTDEDYSGGQSYTSSTDVDTSNVSNPAPQAVYQTVRFGNFSYTIPNLTPNADYTVRLHFNELYWNSAGSRVFNVSINGQQALQNFDIYQAAGGSNIAIVKQFPTTADTNGNVTIQFNTVTDNAMVNGVELYSGTLPSPTPTPTPVPVSSIAINTGGNSSSSFLSDQNYTGGQTYTSTDSVNTSGVLNPAPQSVYQSVRFGNFSYTIPNLFPNTNYLVKLDFNELYQNSVGSRVFNVLINGQQVLTNFDIYKSAGGKNKAIARQFLATSDANGRIFLAFSTVVDNAMVNGIELSQANSIQTYSLTGNVYSDTNQNGFQDTGELGYNDATVTLDSGQSTVTDANGNYSFSNLPTDIYTETLTLPAGYTTTTANPVNVTLNADTTQNFGVAQGDIDISAGGTGSGSFLSDQDFSGGQPYTTTNSVDTSGVTNPAPDSVYQSARFGNFSYTIPNLTPNSTYTVRLHFNELYWNSAGSRVFNVSINGSNVLNNFDIYQAASGANKAVVEEFPATVDANGNITINFSTVTDNAMVNGIELVH